MSGARGSRWALRPAWAPVALLAGASAGAAVLGLYSAAEIALALAASGSDVSDVGPAVLPTSTVLGMVVGYAFVAYLIGLATVGAYGWLILHLCGLREPWAAALFGAVANTLAVLVITKVHGFEFAPLGALVGLTVHRVAYRRRWE